MDPINLDLHSIKIQERRKESCTMPGQLTISAKKRQCNIGGKVLALLFFKPIQNSDKWTCIHCGNVRQCNPKKSGYSNLENHCRSQHAEIVHEIEANAANGDPHQRSICATLWPRKTQRIFSWLDIVINTLQPFSFVECKTIRAHIGHDSISRNTLTKYMGLLAGVVEEKIMDVLPDKFAIVFDGWSTSDRIHYLGMYATFPLAKPVYEQKRKKRKTMNDGEQEENEEDEVVDDEDDMVVRRYGQVLLSFAPIGGDSSKQDADAHVEHTTYVLAKYNRTWNNVVCLIGDNCPVNKSFANKVNRPLIGCASHRLNLAVQKSMDGIEGILMKVNGLMKKLGNLVAQAKLSKFTHLKPVVRNATRWSSTYEMVKRYQELKRFLPELQVPEIDNLLLTVVEERELLRSYTKLHELNEVTKKLQYENWTLADVRFHFDCILEGFPRWEHYLGTGINLQEGQSTIVHSAYFESAIVKLQLNRENELNASELRALRRIKYWCDDTPQTEDRRVANYESLSIVDKAKLRKREMTQGRSYGSSSTYMDPHFLLPTSNMCERLFSKAGWALSERRSQTLPSNFESQMFLNINRELWGGKDVNDLVMKELD